MKLELGMPFGEHMVLQREKEIRIFGRGAAEDTVEVSLGDRTASARTEKGNWCVTFPPMPACERTSLSVRSSRTGERIELTDVAVGEVWLAGGQSNMEFMLRYDVEAEDLYRTPDDHDLRFFLVPRTPFLGYLEKENCPDAGFWRCWEDREDREYFSAAGFYMGQVLRRKLDVPVAVIGCYWGGTPAAAWTAIEDLWANPALKPVLDWQEEAVSRTDWARYLAASEAPDPEQTPEQKDFERRFMMGEDMSEFFKNFDPSKLPVQDYAFFDPGPRACIRPSGLYGQMLRRVAPFAIRGAVWYQGEDDDARGWADFYDESMKTLFRSWRKLWNEELPIFQVELAPFRGVGITGAKRYDLMRHQQAKAAAETPGVRDVCILDCGEEFNIHPRRKRKVGERLAKLAMRYVYGDRTVSGECPRFEGAERAGEGIRLRFAYAEGGMRIREGLEEILTVRSGGADLPWEARADGDAVILSGGFPEGPVEIRYCESNWCVPALFNSEGDPAYGFSAEV